MTTTKFQFNFPQVPMTEDETWAAFISLHDLKGKTLSPQIFTDYEHWASILFNKGLIINTQIK